MEKIVQIPIQSVMPGPHELRLKLDEDSLEELASSIRRVGVIVPLFVSGKGDDFVVIAGHRRLAAARKVGLSTVPCIVRSGEKSEATELSIVENLFRVDLTPIEQAAAMKDIIDGKIMDTEEVARMVHRSVHWVNAQLDMLKWPTDVLDLVHRGKASVAAASNLALITDDVYRAFLLRNAEDSGATARITAAWLQAWRASMPQAEAVEQPAVAGPAPALPALPQAPCLCCNQMFRTDALAMVLVCPGCVAAVRGVGTGG